MRRFILLLYIPLLISCGGDRKRPIYVDIDESDEESLYAQSGSEVVVPFRNDNGVKYVAVKVNGVEFEMIFDTGCSSTLISVAEVEYLYKKGKLSNDDFLGISQSQIADGSVVENMVVNLREVIINDQILCSNVIATVSRNISAPLLLGNEVLDRLATITIDNENSTLNFKLK